MASEEALKAVVEFSKMPATAEKQEIERQYLSDEISSFEFYSLASRYIAKTKGAPHAIV